MDNYTAIGVNGTYKDLIDELNALAKQGLFMAHLEVGPISGSFGTRQFDVVLEKRITLGAAAG